MAKEQKPESPSAEQLHGQQLERGLEQLKSGGKWILIMGVIFAAAAIGYAMNKQSKAKSAMSASMDLLAAGSLEELQAVMTNHAESKPAALAQLQLANQQFQADEYEQALSSYEDFKNKYPAHDLVDFAEFGRVKCLEALGRLEEAQAGYSALTGNSSLEPLANLGVARCLEQLDKLDEALALYKELEERYEGTPWADQAADFRGFVEQALGSKS